MQMEWIYERASLIFVVFMGFIQGRITNLKQELNSIVSSWYEIERLIITWARG